MAARRAAVALPMPLLPPVTSATFGIDSAGISIPVIYAHIVIFAASITGRHLARSPSMNALRSSGDPPTPCSEFCSRLILHLSLLRKPFTALFTLLTMSGRVPVGATTEYHAVASKPFD